LIAGVSEEIYRKFDKLVYIIRDPRDSLISMSHFQFTPYKMKYHPVSEQTPEEWASKHAEWWGKRWRAHVLSHLQLKDQVPLYAIFYERLVKDFRNEIRSLSDALGLGLTNADIETIQENTSAAKMKKKAPHHVRKAGKPNDENRRHTHSALLDCTEDLLAAFGYKQAAIGSKQSLPFYDATALQGIRPITENKTSMRRVVTQLLTRIR
jgi:hypothetical protein